MQGCAGHFGLGRIGTQHRFRKMLAGIHRQLAHRGKLASGRVPGTCGRVYAPCVRHRALEHPSRQRRFAQRFARVNVFLDHAGYVQPTSLLPQLKGPLLHAKAPAHAKVYVARVVGYGSQVHGGVMEAVAQNGPQEPALRSLAVAKELEAFGGGLFQHAGVHLVALATRRFVAVGCQVKLQNIAAHLFVEAGAGFLAQAARCQQGFEYFGGGERCVKRVCFQAQRVLQRFDDVAHGVQAHHVGRAEGAAAGATHLFAGQVVHHIKSQTVILHLFHRRQHAGNADAVGDEVGRILGAHHAFAQCGSGKGFHTVQRGWQRGGGVDQLHQRHVARRVEEVDTAKTRL